MKRFILCLLIILVTPLQLHAESTATADANLDFEYIVEGGTYYSTEAPNLIQAGKVDGSNVGHVGAYWDKEKGDASLPNLYRDMGFHIADLGYEYIDISIMKEMSDFYFFNSAESTGVSPLERAFDKIKILDHFPKGPNILEVSYNYGRTKKHDELPIGKVYTLTKQAWKKGDHAKNVLILYRVTPITKGDILALGLAGVNSTAHAGSSEPGKSVTSGAFGTGIGTAQSFVWNGCYYLIIFFNQSDTKVAQATPKKPLIKISQVVKTTNVFFDFDSAEIYSEKQLATIKTNAELIAQKLKKLSPEQKIFIVGCTSEEGTDDYNIVLGGNRAHNVALAYCQILLDDFSPEFLNDKIKYLSMGEISPSYAKREKNRRTYILVGEEF